MATATLVLAGVNRLRYLITGTGTGTETVAISTVGGATPDVLTDALGAGLIKKLAQVVANGYGSFAAGAQTQAKARALWLSDVAGGSPGSALNIPLARCTITPRTLAPSWLVDADVSAGNPIINVTVEGGGVIGSAYLDIEVPGAIGA